MKSHQRDPSAALREAHDAPSRRTPPGTRAGQMTYVLITSAKNEQAFIGRTLDSVVAQTLLPERWIIVDDGSSDRTAAIVADYAWRYPWIELVRQPAHPDR